MASLVRPLLFSLSCTLACGGGGTETSTDASTGGSTGGAASSTGADDPTTSGGTADASTSTGSSSTDASSTSASTVASSTSGDPTTGTTATTGDATTGGQPDGTCRGDADCDDSMAEFCFAPDETNCGECQIPAIECNDQLPCDPGLTCVPFAAPCACDPFAMECVPVLGCTKDTDCPPERFCGDAMTCELKTCDVHGVDCPALFDCDPDAQGDHCVRHPCATDADCGDAFCVEGHCFDTLGACMPPAP